MGDRLMGARQAVALRCLTAALALGVGLGLTPSAASPGATAPARPAPAHPTPRPSYVPPIKHVFVLNIENKAFNKTWSDTSAAPYLAHHLRMQGVLLNYYYGTAHHSLPNYLAQISGQAPNRKTQHDCGTYSRFVRTGPAQPPQQAVGSGCVYPSGVRTLPQQMSAHGLSWKGYMQQAPGNCVHPKLGAVDTTRHATPRHNYAVRHNPFMYFRWITSRKAYCRHHVRRLGDLRSALRHVRSTPALSYISPDLCSDGHDKPCANGDPGGLVSVNRFLKVWVRRILASPAFQKDGMLVITADESGTSSGACCGEQSGPNTTRPGLNGPGGGRVGALVLSQWTAPDTFSTTPYNHYSLLASLEELFGLGKLGMAGQAGLPVFGLDVYNNNWWTP
jgi:phosphatidylinositol-3-phosphatase